ncbi:MAG: sulfide/dihydroorotate dehydrogenase-like FAD/NAD-binding protein [Candidatus Hydrothermota bacterium]|nr:MAG: sulfide/dihydroorotate dehydrogenase-like FAD/NAD-binding protein [Candidatus Hydrothermae bacterium]
MGYKIVKKRVLGPDSKMFVVEAPYVARNAKPGQFIILRVNEKGERIPLTIAGSDREKGLVTIIFQEVGKTTKLLGTLEEGDEILDFVGPLGKPTEIENFGTVMTLGGGFGTAVLYPLVKAIKEKGNYVITAIGARTRDLIILEEEMREISDEVYITTDDGSYGRKGFVTEVLADFLKEGRKIDRVFSVGPVPMMKATANVTKPYGVKTIVSLNPIMVDGTGMCGACRVEVGGKTKFACIDGPEFDAHEVNFDLLMKRLGMYREEEKASLERFLEEIKKAGRA